jgi:hypothetical protein
MSLIVSASQRCSVDGFEDGHGRRVGLMWAGRQGQCAQLPKWGLGRQGAGSKRLIRGVAGKGNGSIGARYPRKPVSRPIVYP